ncbi:tetratricopeptide repeat protein, partial [Candidatus Acetothermia bacterium]|nr:tetratricopeptide repeat protein [Candidatus Acetothermia bacterium]
MSEKSTQGLRVKLFGRFEVWRDEALVPAQAWGRHKTLSLLKILLTDRGKIFIPDQLIEALFPDLEPAKAAKNLYGRIGELRYALEPNLDKSLDSHYIVSKRQGGYSFSKDSSCWLDTEEFQKKVETAYASERAGRWPEALETYRQAIELYQGDFLAEDLYEEWTITPRRHWRELYLTALSQCAECHARMGEYSQALEQCQKALKTEPGRESVYRQKMLYHSIAGQHSEALKVYSECLKVLQAHLNVKPSPETCTLHEQILRGNLSSEGYPPPAGPARHNLPSSVTSFIGREREIVKVKWLLNTTRLLTLTGAGGSGKTRLALQVSASMVKDYSDGVWWVELASISDPKLVPQAIASALGVRETQQCSLTDALSDYLKSKQMLLVLDNCEHLISACAHMTETLLHTCPDLQVLATSREALGIAGETVWQVPPLVQLDAHDSLPLKILKQYEAISLFVERALSSQPEFGLTLQNAPAVMQICQKLDGLPLAIELAAARVKVLSVTEIAARLDDRFRLLTSGSRTALPRQQTLQAAMDWSYDLLSSAEQTLLRRLSIFAGGFTLEAVETICARDDLRKGDSRIALTEILDLLTHLIDKSLVLVDQRDGETRYRLLETVRQFGREKLLDSKEESVLRERHLDWFLALAEKAESELQGPAQSSWLERLEQEQDNLRSALEYAKDRRKTEAGLRMVTALSAFWLVRGYLTEGRSQVASVLAQAGSLKRTITSAKALNAAGTLAEGQGDYLTARSYHEESLAIFRGLGGERDMAKTLQNLGSIAWKQGEYTRARSLSEEGLNLSRKLGDAAGIAILLNNLGLIARAQGEYTQAKAFYEESLEINTKLGNKQAISYLFNNLGSVAENQGDYQTARTLYEKSLALRRELGDKPGIANSLNNLGSVALKQSDYASAHALYEEGLLLQRELRDKWNIAFLLEGTGVVSLAQGQLVRAAHLCGAVAALRGAMRASLPPTNRAAFDRTVATIREKLEEKVFAAAWTQGQSLTLEQAIEYA